MYNFGQFFKPQNLIEALAIYNNNPQAIIIAGGTDVLIKLRDGQFSGADLISIGHLEPLKMISQDDNGDIIIGALASFDALSQNPLIRQNLSILAEAAATVGGPQIRRAGTIGGNLCNGAPSADTAASLYALEAVLEIASKQGNRLLPIEQFHLAPGKVDLKDGEILTKIHIKKACYCGRQGYYFKYAMREAMDIATLGCAIVIGGEQAIDAIKIAMTVAAPTPIRLHTVEQALCGLGFSEAKEQIGDLVRLSINPRNSWRASKDFRLHIAGVIAEDALEKAIEKLGGAAQC